MIVGVDGCEDGWMAAIDDGRRVRLEVVATIESIVDELPGALFVVDIPIGLMEHGDRRADSAARELLRGRASCVFNAPLRPMLACRDYEDANAMSRRINGKGFSKQGFALIPKIAEVDELVRGRTGKTRIIEGHPEVSFALMNDRAAIPEPKRTADGQRFRLALLREMVHLDSESIVRSFPARLHIDAIDAMALVWTGRRFCEGRHESLPAPPDRDALGVVAAIHA